MPAILHVKANGRLVAGIQSDPSRARGNPWSSGSYPLPQPRGSKVTFEPGTAQQVEFAYTAANFADPTRTRFRHRLIGFEDAWQEVEGRRTALYSNLRPGIYEIRVEAQDHHRHWSKAQATFAFVIRPYYWQSAWFRTTSAIALILIVGAVHRWRLHGRLQIERLQQELKLAQERERLARDLHDGLGGRLTEIALLADTNPDEARSRQLAESAHEALHSVKNLIWNTDSRNDSLESLVTRLAQTVSNRALKAGLACRVKVPSEFPHLPVSGSIRQEILLAASEAVHNAIKHAKASLIRFECSLHSGALIVTVTDDGEGIRPDAQVGSKGLGLDSMRRRIEGIGGDFAVEPASPRGARIRFTVPLSHLSPKPA